MRWLTLEEAALALRRLQERREQAREGGRAPKPERERGKSAASRSPAGERR
jgi:hypothetical protein